MFQVQVADQPSLDELESAATLIYQSMPPTPQYRWPLLEARVGTTVWVKHENHTPTGAFKGRGGLIYLEELCPVSDKPGGVVSATRGNHGQSVGFAARHYGILAAVVVPHGNSIEKNAAMRALGVEVIEQGHDFQAAAEIADEIAIDRRWHRFPSFHPLLVRGVGTYALELFRAVPGSGRRLCTGRNGKRIMWRHRRARCARPWYEGGGSCVRRSSRVRTLI